MEVGRKCRGDGCTLYLASPGVALIGGNVSFPASSWAYCVLFVQGVLSVVLTCSLEEGVKAGRYLVAAGGSELAEWSSTSANANERTPVPLRRPT